MVKLLENYQMLLDSQHSFRKGRSCIINLLTLLETVTKRLDNVDHIEIIFLDFAKAVDKVPHHRLICKLENHSITGKLNNWIKAWLN